MAIHGNSLSSLDKYGSFTPNDLEMLRTTAPVGPPMNYAETQKAETLKKLRRERLGQIAGTDATGGEISLAFLESGACHGLSQDIFHPDLQLTKSQKSKPSYETEEEEFAKAICHQCAVEKTCLEYALTTRQSNGVWGGMNERERRRITNPRRRRT